MKWCQLGSGWMPTLAVVLEKLLFYVEIWLKDFSDATDYTPFTYV